MKGLKRFLNKFESVMTAVTFAEEGEYDTAREIMQQEELPQERVSKKYGDYTTLTVKTAGVSK
ncbi:MAG: hypothetical protein HY755_10380 [Nitrospirae bacterium]|nr:hypothetical protein [Nitrospirota bacterium]